MAADLWTSVFSLAGVALGGGLTALAQRATQRSAERAEERRQTAATTESRRAEQIDVLKEFVSCAQAAERAAYRRPDPWGHDEDGWMTQTGPVMTALWTASGNVTLLCDEALREPVRTYGHALKRRRVARHRGRRGQRTPGGGQDGVHERGTGEPRRRLTAGDDE